MNFVNAYSRIFKALLPAPFTIALLLTAFVLLMALLRGNSLSRNVEFSCENHVLSIGENSGLYILDQGEQVKELVFTDRQETTLQLVDKNSQFVYKYELKLNEDKVDVQDLSNSNLWQTLDFWYNGLWNKGGLSFAVQAMLMLLLGHVLALSRPFNLLIQWVLPFCSTTARSAYIITFLTILVSLFNWGLGLLFGAVFARKIGEYALSKGISLNYPLIGASGYVGLMVWHGGISGSALSKVSESGHLRSLVKSEHAAALPESIGFNETVFSSMNCSAMLLLLIVVPLFMYWLAKRVPSLPFNLSVEKHAEPKNEVITGAEKLDHSFWLAKALGIGVLTYAFMRVVGLPDFWEFKFMNPDFINFMMLGLVFVSHRNIASILSAADEAINGVTGILMQFPLYFGIMGIMSSSGLIVDIAMWFAQVSTSFTYPLFTFFSAGIINIFVPSGGGQWGVQGPIIVETAVHGGIPLAKSIMALAYGDQLTNMLQPFWALPLLGVTGLKAKEILPYTLVMLLAGFAIFTFVLVFF